MRLRLQILYGFFLGSVLLLAYFSLRPDLIYVYFLIAVMIAGLVFTETLGPGTRVPGYRKDWTISPLECTPEDDVTITLTNLSELFETRGTRPIEYKKGDPIWYMAKEGSPKEKQIIRKADKQIIFSDSYTWTLTRADFNEGPGTYQLRPYDWDNPLHRRIIVSDNTKGESRNKELIRQAIKDRNEFAGNIDRVSSWCEKYCAPGYIHHNLLRRDLNRDQMGQYLVELMLAFPDFNKSMDDIVAEGNKVIVRYAIQATHKGNFGGITATGKRVSIKGSDIFKIEGGKILEWWDFADYIGPMTQVGAIPSTGPRT